jgi:carbonic anhydrase/acetyltransferase-like protein (isoleucine patch superfamily)
MGSIIVGENSNIQDGCILHCVPDISTVVGKNVTVGHGAILHSCSIGDGTLVGMGAIILDGARIGRNSIVAAGSVIPPYSVIGDGALVMGAPAKIKRELTEEDIKNMKKGTSEYLELVKNYSM